MLPAGGLLSLTKEEVARVGGTVCPIKRLFRYPRITKGTLLVWGQLHGNLKGGT